MEATACPTCGRVLQPALRCISCGKDFTMQRSEIAFYEKHRLTDPRHCQGSREKRRAKHAAETLSVGDAEAACREARKAQE